MKKQYTDWKKNISKHVSDKGHILDMQRILKTQQEKIFNLKKEKELRDASPKNINRW